MMENDTAQSVEGSIQIKVLDKGFVNIEDPEQDFMGGDLKTVNMAKVSNAKRAYEMGDREKKLLRFLWRNKHTSPFEHTLFTFHVKLPLFVRSEWQRHRTWKFNEISGRYVEFGKDFSLEFYIP